VISAKPTPNGANITRREEAANTASACRAMVEIQNILQVTPAAILNIVTNATGPAHPKKAI
jgi:hypothetical protein